MKKRPISKSRKLFRTPNRSHDTRTRKVSCHDLGWLEDDQSTSDLVVVWVTWKQFSKIFLRKEYEERILTRFGLTNAQRYARVTRYSFAALNNVEESSVNMQTYLVKANRFSLLWSYDKTLGRTRSVFMGDHWYEGLLQNVLDCFRGPAVHHPMYLAEGASMVLAIYCEKWISLAEHNIRPIEERTGFGGSFVSVSAAEKALGKLSAQMSGVKSELTAVEATLRFNKRLSRFIAECLQSATHCPVTEPRLAAFKLGKNALMASCKATKDRLDCDHERLEEYVKRAETQLTALFHLITQEDIKASLAIAEESKALAEAAKRDSDSMKTLSVLTMTFLPGTALATIFAMPFFDWNGSTGAHVDHNFWIYRVTTIPLTILKLLIW